MYGGVGPGNLSLKRHTRRMLLEYIAGYGILDCSSGKDTSLAMMAMFSFLRI